MDASQKYKLSPEQKESYEVLKTLNINSEDKQLCWWARNYSLQRLIEVYNEAKHNNARSIGAYMTKLLKYQRVVHNARIEANRAFAEDYKNEHKWHGLKILKRYVKFPMGRDEQELDLNLDPGTFINILIQKHENSDKQ